MFQPYLHRLPLTGGLAALALLLAGCATVLDAPPSAHLLVRTDCGAAPACYPSIQQAVDAAAALPAGKPVRITVGPGAFEEKVTIERGDLTLVGAGREQTRLYEDWVAEHAGRFHRDNWGTAGSATLTINADRVTVRDMTVENTFDHLGNNALPAGDARKVANSQAVAVLLDIASDRVMLDDVALLGYQDTLFANGGRAYVRDSLIAGNVDFIFGNGQLLIEDSELRSRAKPNDVSDGQFHAYIVAPRRRWVG